MSKRLLQKTGRGFALNFSSSSLVATASFVTQLVLAWHLTKHDFGVYAIAISFSTFVIVFRDGGVARWLARLSSEEFERQCSNAFLLAFFCSLLAGALICGLSFIVGQVYGQPQVTQVMLVLGAVLPFGAYSVVGRPRLQVNLRFRALATLRLGAGFLRYGLTIAFAAWGWGPLSFALPVVVVTFFELAFHVAVTRLRIHGREISLRGCYDVFRQSKWSLSGSYATAILRQADYAVLGLFVSTETLGIYYFALQLSTRPVLLFSESLRSVILPVFSRVGSNSERETRGLRYAGAFLGTIAVPAMLFICATIEPLTELLWKGRWAAAVGSIQLLTVAMPLNMLAMFVEVLSQSRGRFGVWTASVLVRGLGRGLAAFIAASVAGRTHVTLIAGVMAAYIAVSAGVQAFALLKDMRITARPLISPFAPPVIASLFVTLVVLVISPSATGELAARGMLVNSIVFVIGLAAAFAAFCRPSVRDVVELARRTLTKGAQ